MKLKHFIIIAIILIFLGISCVSAGNFTELQDNIDSGNDTIELGEDYERNHNELNVISIENRTINGNNHKITGMGDIKVTGDVGLNDIRFDDTTLPISGECRSLKINNCTFRNNYNKYFINVTSDMVEITNSRFISDKEFFNHDFINITSKTMLIANSSFEISEMDKGAVELNCDVFTIVNSTFRNFARDVGGAVYTKKGRGSIIDSVFINNTAKKGGAIYSASQLELINCSFLSHLPEGPSSVESGGALYLEASKNMVKNSYFSQNNAEIGGAICVLGDDTTILNSIFDKNSASEAAIYWRGNSGIIRDSKFADNDGFAVKWIGNGGKIINSKFTESTSYLDKWLIQWTGADGLISKSTFTQLNMFGVKWNGLRGQIDGCEFSKNKPGSVLWNAKEGKLTNSHFTQCGDAVGWYGANGVVDKCLFEKITEIALQWDGANGKIMNSKFNNNKVFYVVLEINGKNCLVDKCEFISNSGKQYGAVRWNPDNGKIQNSVFRYNTAKVGDGAISIGDKYLKISKNNVFYKNTPIEIDVINSYPSPIYYNSNQVVIFKIYEKASAKPVKGAKLILESEVYGSDQYKVFKSNSKGVVKIKGLSKFTGFGPIGNTRIITLDGKCYSEYSENDADLSKYKYFTTDDMEWTFIFLLKKGKCIVKAPKLTAKHHKSKYFKITVKDKFTKKKKKNFGLKVKIYTGKKYRALTLKTNKKGVASFNTKNLSKGTHKVVIKSKNKNYSINVKSKITIK